MRWVLPAIREEAFSRLRQQLLTLFHYYASTIQKI